jgi:hypothetical protein
MTKIRDEILTRRQASEDYLSTKRDAWDKYEMLFHNQLADKISSEQKSQIFDPKLSTLLLERSYRVMAQLATGKARAISKNDLGTTMLMDLIVDKYVNSNANAQFDLLTKFRMVDLYSNIYGNFFTLTDWDVKKNGYMGPDIWLLNIRDVFPQVGAVSIQDSDYIIIRTWKPLSYFEDLKKTKREGFTNLSEIITKLKDTAGKKDTRDSNSTSEREQDQYPKGEAAKGKGYYEVLTQYEGDRWVDFCVDADLDFRDTKNPHDNEELPVDCKYSIPLLDDFMGMGDCERGAPMQQVINSNWNLYMDAVKMSIFPPVIINKDNLASPSSAQYIPAAKWLARGQISNVAMPLQLNPKGIDTFNNTLQVANGSLLNLFGTTDTTVTQQTETGYGKTPKALQMQQQRENTRDNADRFFMEQYLKNVYKKMVNLISKKQSSAITMRMFDEEIQNLARSYPEIADMYDEKTGKLTIDKKHTGSTLYDYEIISGSSYALDEKSQMENLTSLFQMFVANPQIGQQLIQLLDQQGFQVKLGEMFKRIVTKSGIQDWDKILVEKTPMEMTNTTLNQHANQFKMAVQQAMGGNMNQVPPQPGQPQGIPQPGQMPPSQPAGGQPPMMGGGIGG